MSFALRNLVYWGLPTLYCLLVMALYFSGSHALVDWVAPRTQTLPWSDYGDRELGILENAQNVLLLACLFVLARFWPKVSHWLQRAGAGAAMLVVAFMFLEEISYGVHFRDWLTGAPRFGGDVNFHNTSGYTHRMKQFLDVLMIIWFVLLPLLAPKMRSAWIGYLAPPRIMIMTIVAAVLVSELAHALDDQGLAIRDALSNNISEFREVFTYYIWLLYCWIMVRRPWPGGNAAT